MFYHEWQHWRRYSASRCDPQRERQEMSGQDSKHPTMAEFLADLRKFRLQCGKPSYRGLADISWKLSELYPGRKLPSLSPTAISENLAGKRKEGPTATFVASFILCCTYFARDTGTFPDDRGLAVLQDWQERLQAARDGIAPNLPEAAQNATAAAAMTAPAPDQGTGPEATEPATGAGLDTGASAPGSGEVAEACPPSTVKLPVAQQEYVARYGPYGEALLAQMKAGIPDAVYRVAVLLTAAPQHRATGHSLLVPAVSAGHCEAADLYEVSAARLPREVAQHAYRLGEEAAAEGSLAAALVFYQCAAESGLYAAAVKLAIALLTKHGEHQAAALLQAGVDHQTPQHLIAPSERHRSAPLVPGGIQPPVSVRPPAQGTHGSRI